MKLSVIILSYNQEKYIEQAIDSVLKQHHDYTYEIIICDDASKDSTPTIIAKYAKQYPVIVPIFRRQNLGVVKNLYDGLSKAKGKYIMLCGGDDYYLSGKIKAQIEYIDNHESVGLVHSDVLLVSENGHPKRIKYGFEHSSVEHLLCNYDVNAPTMTFRKNHLEEYIKEIKPYEKNWLMEDLPIALWFTIYHKMRYIPGAYVAYRIVDNSISHKVSADGKFNFEKSCFEVSKYFHKIYPECISTNIVIYRHINQVLLLDKDAKYKKYCKKLLECYDSNENRFKYLIMKARICSKIFNKLTKQTITNIKRYNILKQLIIKAIYE